WAAMAKAKTPQAKSKLAQDIFKTAREEPDLVVRFAALQAAKRLAVDASDGKLGLEIVREIVQTYEPFESMPVEDRLAEAERLWTQSEKAQGREKLAKQLEAIEQWLYCGVVSGLTAKQWANRLDALKNSVVLVKPTASEKALAQKLADRTLMLINRKSKLKMSVRGNVKTPTALNPHEHVVQLPDAPSAYWRVKATPEGYVQFQNTHSGLWLGMYDYPGQPNAVAVAAQQAEPNQNTLWILKPAGLNSVYLVHAATGLYLRPWDGTTQSNYGIHLYPLTDDAAYLWVWQVMP
ncbi:MAG: RICIN domain-containing protein, partial [Thermoguttaceae bacterium]|nr:RICIN domain-containing protein [Thermoguttaceae bacterium]